MAGQPQARDQQFDFLQVEPRTAAWNSLTPSCVGERVREAEEAVGRSDARQRHAQAAYKSILARLTPSDSERLQQQLVSDLAQLGDGEALAAWGYRVLPLKNQLLDDDCHALACAGRRRRR